MGWKPRPHNTLMPRFNTWLFLDVRRKGEAMADRRVPGQAPESAGLRFGPLGRLMMWLGIVSVAFVVVVILVPVNPWFPEATREAGEVDNLFKFMLAASERSRSLRQRPPASSTSPSRKSTPAGRIWRPAFAVSVISLFFIRTEFQEERDSSAEQRSLRAEIQEGVSWLWHQPLIRYMAFLTGGLNFAGNANSGLSGYARTFAAAMLTALAGKA